MRNAGSYPEPMPQRFSDRVDGVQLDPVLERLELLFELLEAVDGNVRADLVFEKLLAELRR